MEPSETPVLKSPTLKSPSPSISPPPSSQLPTTHSVAVRTPSPPTPQLTSPPPTAQLSNTTALAEAAAAVLYSHDHVANAPPDELRAMVDHLTNALRDMRLSAAHYKLQHNMAVMESQEAASRMAVELAMAHRELDVLQQAEEKRRNAAAAAGPDSQTHAETANAANAIIMAEMGRHNQLLRAENDQLRDLFEQQKRLIEHREGELASLIDENDQLKSRIRKNRDHMAPFLEHMNDNPSPRSTYATPRRLHRAPLSHDSIRGPNNFEALLLADKMLSQETATAPATPRTATHAQRSRGHHRGAQSMSSLPNTPQTNRRAHPYARPPRTPPTHYSPATATTTANTTVPHSAPPAHHHQNPAPDRRRRQSSNSTITASSLDDEEAFTDREDTDTNPDHIAESHASQMASSMLRQGPGKSSSLSSNLVQSKLFGHVKKANNTARVKERDLRSDAVGLGLGLGIGGLRSEE